MGYEILDNIFTDKIPKVKNKNIYYLSKAITLMTEADIIIFMPGWKDSRGCKIEYEIAKEYGIPYIDISNIDINKINL